MTETRPICPDCGEPRELGKKCLRCDRPSGDIALRCAVRRGHMAGHKNLSGFSKAVAILKEAAEKNRGKR